MFKKLLAVSLSNAELFLRVKKVVKTVHRFPVEIEATQKVQAYSHFFS